MTTLYCILARSAETGVIFRRGPSKQIRLISWNLKKHTFQPGQWFKGQIYVRKSDLSPDGTKLVYFAAKHKGELPTWIAVSSPPYLKAHVLWGTIGTWNDLSLFETDNVLALATYRSDSSLEPAVGFEMPRQLQVKHKPWPGYFYVLADHDRLVRDGWKVHDGDPFYRGKPEEHCLIYRKTVLGGSRTVDLEMSATCDAKVCYALCDSDGSVVDLKADWAEAQGEYVLFSQSGKLFRMRITKINERIEFGQAIELADFSDMKFEALEAPDDATKW